MTDKKNNLYVSLLAGTLFVAGIFLGQALNTARAQEAVITEDPATDPAPEIINASTTARLSVEEANNLFMDATLNTLQNCETKNNFLNKKIRALYNR